MAVKAEPFTWRDSILKQEQITFTLTVKPKGPGRKLDLVIPLHQLAELQAKNSFAAGASQALVFIGEAIKAGKKLDDDIFAAQFAAWDLSDMWAQAQEKREADAK